MYSTHNESHKRSVAAERFTRMQKNPKNNNNNKKPKKKIHKQMITVSKTFILTCYMILLIGAISQNNKNEAY